MSINKKIRDLIYLLLIYVPAILISIIHDNHIYFLLSLFILCLSALPYFMYDKCFIDVTLHNKHVIYNIKKHYPPQGQKVVFTLLLFLIFYIPITYYKLFTL